MKSRIPCQGRGMVGRAIVTIITLARRGPALAVWLVLCALVLSVSASAKKATITTFDALGAGTAAGQGTLALAINPAGVIAGFYVDASNVSHGYVRARDGAITTFDAPGAGTGASQGTRPLSINPEGAIAGDYHDGSNAIHGFLRAPDGTITTFDVAGAGTGAGQGTAAEDINPAGAIAGTYEDASSACHGFLRAPDGTITTFDAPGAGTGAFQGTMVFTVDNLNPAGAIAGVSLDASNVYHGFLRAPDSAITTFDAPGAGTGAFQGTLSDGIDQAGTIEGVYADASNVAHGFLRAPDGTITTFDVPGAGTGAGAPGCISTLTCQGAVPENINAPGAVTGEYVDASGVNHGFLRAKDGSFVTFDAPGAGSGSGQGTIPVCNNPVNSITGYYIDASGVDHGFLRTP